MWDVAFQRLQGASLVADGEIETVGLALRAKSKRFACTSRCTSRCKSTQSDYRLGRRQTTGDGIGIGIGIGCDCLIDTDSDTDTDPE